MFEIRFVETQDTIIEVETMEEAQKLVKYYAHQEMLESLTDNKLVDAEPFEALFEIVEIAE